MRPDWRQGKLRVRGMDREAAMEATRVANAAANERRRFKGDRREMNKATAAGRRIEDEAAGAAAIRKERERKRRVQDRQRGRRGRRGGRGRGGEGRRKLGPTQPRPSKVRNSVRGKRSIAIIRR